MQLFVDLSLSKIVTKPGFANSPQRIEVKRGDAGPLELLFARGTAAAELAAGSLIRLALKEQGKYDSAPVMAAAAWTAPSEAGGAYTAFANFGTSELNGLLEALDEDESNDRSFVDLMGEVSWSEDNGATWTTSNTVTWRVHNDIVREGEALPTSIGELVPLPSYTARLMTAFYPLGLTDHAGGGLPYLSSTGSAEDLAEHTQNLIAWVNGLNIAGVSAQAGLPDQEAGEIPSNQIVFVVGAGADISYQIIGLDTQATRLTAASRAVGPGDYLGTFSQALTPAQRREAMKNLTGHKRILIAGQSNALGRGTEAAISLSKAPDENIKIWNHGTGAFETWNLATNTMQLVAPITSDGTSGAGPTNNAYNMAWATAKFLIADNFCGAVEIILEAEGNEIINNFIPATSEHWARLEQQITAAGWDYVDLVIWHQGESDRSRSAENWIADLNTLVEQFENLSVVDERTIIVLGELSQTYIESTPVQLDSNNIMAAWVQTLHNGRIRIAPVGGCDVKVGDEIHFSGPGLVQAGRIIADTFRSAQIQPSTAINVAQLRREILEPTLFLSGVIFDLDARDATGDLVTNDITSWSDRHNNIPVTIPTGSAANATGKAVFMQSAQALQLNAGTSNTTFTVFAVVTFNEGQLLTSNQVLIDGQSTSDVLIFTLGQSGTGEVGVSCGTLYKPGVVPTGGLQSTLAITVTGGNATVFLNGVQIGSGAVGSNGLGGTIYIGNTQSGSSTSNIAIHKIVGLDYVATLAEIKTWDLIYRGSF